MKTLQRLNDDALLDTLHKLVARERNDTAELLTCLGEVDRRKLYAERGYSSMFAYCLDELHMAEPSIYVRIHAARCCRRLPTVLQRLRRGQLHLCAITLLSPHLTEKNCDKLLAAAEHKSKRQIQEMLRDLAPKPDVKDTVRKLPAAQPVAVAQSTTPVEFAVAPTATSPTPSWLPATSGPSAPPPVPAANPATRPVSAPEPLGCGRYKVQCTVDAGVRRKIEQAKDLTRQKNPTGDLATLLEAALDKPHRHVPHEVKRQVFTAATPSSKPEAFVRRVSARKQAPRNPQSPSARAQLPSTMRCDRAGGCLHGVVLT